MSEHWKSTPKYWCKHCSCYVRDTKLERQNHEATAKHQGALKRFLRELHRGHEREERDKERAQREIARLNGVVSGSSTPGPSARPQHAAPSAPTEASLKRQREQLAEMGVAVPSDFRPEMALAGEWTVTKTRVVEDKPVATEAKAAGVRKRDVTEEEREEEEAMRGLFKKPRKWGRDTKVLPEEDTELDALLNASTFQAKDERDAVKEEVEEAKDAVKDEQQIKTEPDAVEAGSDAIKVEPDAVSESEAIKTELDAIKTEPETDAPNLDIPDATKSEATVVFKKRKPKNIRQK